MDNKELQKEWWEAPIEKNQWAVSQPLTLWESGKEFGEQPAENATVFIRPEAPPSAVKVWNGGKRDEWAEAFYNENSGEAFTPDILDQPFLFGRLARQQTNEEYGMLDDKSKAMLKEKYNVDVDAPVEDVTEEEGDE